MAKLKQLERNTAPRRRARTVRRGDPKPAAPANEWLWQDMNCSPLDGMKNPDIFTPQCRGGFASSALILLTSHLK